MPAEPVLDAELLFLDDKRANIAQNWHQALKLN